MVGGSNEFARTAALAVAENPGKIYNPFFVYGNSGLGKTHLMHAIGNYIVEHSNKRVLYITSEQFKDDIIKVYKKDDNGTNFNYIEFFKNKYRNIDVLLIDDIQFIIGKDRGQEEFFHTFNTLYESSKQVVISSDKPPKDMETLDDRFKSRFDMGLMADIGYPDYETRIAILQSKLEIKQESIEPELLAIIAQHITSNVRELE